MDVFTRERLKKRSIWQLLFRLKNKENALIELNNLFVDRRIETVKIEEVHYIASFYRVDLKKECQPQLCEMYEKYLTVCLRDKMLTKREISELENLREILRLSGSEIDNIHRKVAGKIYRMELDKALEDKKLSDEEVSFLKQLQQNLLLSDEYVTDIYRVSATERVKRYLEEIIADERLSPEEEMELLAISKNLKVDLQYEAKTKTLLEKYKLFWQIENEKLPSIEVKLRLSKDERCFFRAKCDWLEIRRVTKRLNYSGPTLRFKIVKGVYWRAGSLKPQVITDDVWQKIDSGEVFITNKRLIFCGEKGNKIIKLDRILDFSTYSNGIDIQRDSGKSPFLQFSNNNDLFALILGRVISGEC